MMGVCYLGFALLWSAFVLPCCGSLRDAHAHAHAHAHAPTLSFDEVLFPLYGEQNVKPSGDGKSVSISMDERSSSGFHSKLLYMHGFFSAAIKLPPQDYTAGVVVTFYTANNQRFPGNHDEIDFEFLGHISGGQQWTVQTNFYGNGSTQTGREERYVLWFDPSHDFHNYSILWSQNRILYYVDDVPIREVIRRRTEEAMGGDWPSKPMTLYGTIWDGSNWATSGGKYRVEFKYGPFVANYSQFIILNGSGTSCPIDHKSSSSSSLINNAATGTITFQRIKMESFRRKHMTYSYCYDRNRYAVPPPECVLDPNEAELLARIDPSTFGATHSPSN